MFAEQNLALCSSELSAGEAMMFAEQNLALCSSELSAGEAMMFAEQTVPIVALDYFIAFHSSGLIQSTVRRQAR